MKLEPHREENWRGNIHGEMFILFVYSIFIGTGGVTESS